MAECKRFVRHLDHQLCGDQFFELLEQCALGLLGDSLKDAKVKALPDHRRVDQQLLCGGAQVAGALLHRHLHSARDL